MAITFSSPTSTAVANATSVTVSTPTAPGGGALTTSHVILGCVFLGDVGVGSWVAGSGWTQVIFQDSTVASNVHILWRPATASEPANYTFGAYAASSGTAEGVMFSCAGISTTSPVQTSSGQDANANTSTITCPAVTPTSTDAMLFYAGTSNGNNLIGTSTATGSAGTELFDLNTGAVAAGKRVSAGYYQQLASGSSTGTRTITLTQAGANECGVTLALNPAPTLTEYVGFVPI